MEIYCTGTCFVGHVPAVPIRAVYWVCANRIDGANIKKGSIIVGSRLLGELKVGDIIVFRHGDKLLVKRIAAVGENVISHKGEKLKVPTGYVYVIGDNKENSWDSRYWEKPFVPLWAIIAKFV